MDVLVSGSTFTLDAARIFLIVRILDAWALIICSESTSAKPVFYWHGFVLPGILPEGHEASSSVSAHHGRNSPLHVFWRDITKYE